MISKSQHINDFVVFSRWSRKNYAIFASLRKVVCIGRLSIDICQSSIKKASAMLSLFFRLEENVDEKEEDDLQSQISKLLLSMGLFPLVINNSNSYNQNNIIINHIENPYFATAKYGFSRL